LSAKLDAQPDDPKGWLMLARSYRVLGQEAEARAALKRANADIPHNLELMKAYLETLAEGVGGDRPPPELVSVASGINALDGNDPPALWYLGLDAAARGDKPEAANYWRRLLAALPADDRRRAAVQQRLDALGGLPP
jgi:cytochrome c-type biogenesis protein CcmH